MNFNPESELRHLAILLLTALITGWLLDALTIVLILTLIGYIGWNLRQLFRMYQWLKQPNTIDPPTSHGLWGEIFDDIYKLQQHQLKYRARLKRVIKRFRDSTFALRDGFVMLDQEGNIEWWNPAAERLLGLVQKTDVGQLLTNLIRDPAFKTYFEKNDYEKPLELTSPVNDNVILQYQIALFGKQDRLIIVRDITEMKKLEQVRTDFVANMSHEIRTPITVLAGYLETLSESGEDIPPLWQRALSNMQQQTERMKALIQDLLTLSKLETRRASALPQLVEVDKLIHRVSSDLATPLAEKKQTLKVDCSSSCAISGIESELYSLLSNLIANANKYSPKGSQISICWASSPTGGQLSVQDQGIGIDHRDIPRLTERFYRVEKGRASDTGGTGLGLAIVKHILINHDATLDINSTPGNGSTFICKFPNQRLHTITQTAANA